jgi:flagellum-specific ATP synthase
MERSMTNQALAALTSQIAAIAPRQRFGRVSKVESNTIRIHGLSENAHLGDRLAISRDGLLPLKGEVVQLDEDHVTVLPEEMPVGLRLGQRVQIVPKVRLAPNLSWLGRVIDPFGQPLDGMPLASGKVAVTTVSNPPNPAERKPLGDRLETGMAVFNTLLPIVRGQRVGLFAGSGVGKSSLLGQLGRHMNADLVVFAMIGERGRELRDFIEHTLGPEGMKRSIVVAATSDKSPLIRRRCAWTAMNIAEHFRDQGQHVLFLADSITRFAEAHREIATAAGEMPALKGYPASIAHLIMSLCERAGPGVRGKGDITALFSVLVPGSDMDEPITDILRGTLDGHVVLDREIAERGRFPAIDLLRSVSRSLPRAASFEENEVILRARRLLGTYSRSETMVKAGLYTDGSDPELDQALRVWPELDAFIGEKEKASIQNSFNRLSLILRRAGSIAKPASDARQVT